MIGKAFREIGLRQGRRSKAEEDMKLSLLHRIHRKLIKLRFQPIRVLCFHQVSETFDEESMYIMDWLQTDIFKQSIGRFEKTGYTFISIEEAYERLKKDKWRSKRYVVLTADDGWASLNNILLWLNERQIPITLFLNPAYFDGHLYRNRPTEKYLTRTDVNQLHKKYPLVTIGSHGWKHIAATKQTEQEFEEDTKASVKELSKLPNYIPFFAYTWGRHNESTDLILRDNHLIQVNTNGGMNYNVCNPINREILTSDISI